jgi:hypothetical protein
MWLLAVLFVLASDVMFLVQVFSLLGVPGTELWIEGTREGDALRGCPLQCYSPRKESIQTEDHSLCTNYFIKLGKAKVNLSLSII